MSLRCLVCLMFPKVKGIIADSLKKCDSVNSFRFAFQLKLWEIQGSVFFFYQRVE